MVFSDKLMQQQYNSFLMHNQLHYQILHNIIKYILVLILFLNS